MGMEFLEKGIIYTIIITFVLDIFTNIFAIFPWFIGIMNTTNMAARDASAYNMLFDDTRVAYETSMSNLSVVYYAPLATDWNSITDVGGSTTNSKFTSIFQSIASNTSGSGDSAQPAVPPTNKPMSLNEFLGHSESMPGDKGINPKSRVIMKEIHGYMGDRSALTAPKETATDASGASSMVGKAQHSRYLETITIVTAAVFPARISGPFSDKTTLGKPFYIPWMYHASSIGMHYYK